MKPNRTNCPFCDVAFLSVEEFDTHMLKAHNYRKNDDDFVSRREAVRHATQEHGRALRALHESA